MDIQLLTDFFMWCTVVNAGVLILFSLAILFLDDFIYSMQSKFLPLPRETFEAAIYTVIGFYKMLIFVFNLAPWIALAIIT